MKFNKQVLDPAPGTGHLAVCTGDRGQKKSPMERYLVVLAKIMLNMSQQFALAVKRVNCTLASKGGL